MSDSMISPVSDAVKTIPQEQFTLSSATQIAIWLVDGERYLKEAGTSWASLEKQMPYLERRIYTPNRREHREWFSEQTRLLGKALDQLPDGTKVLLLDSDTYVCEPVPELFEMLDRFDLCAAHAPGHRTAPATAHIPDSFPEPQIGVLAMKNTAAVREVWSAAYALQEQGIETDQAALRQALWFNSLRFAVLPNEYNFRFQFGGQLRDRVKLLHGHAGSAEEYERLRTAINVGYREGYQLPPRIWTPNGNLLCSSTT